MPAWGIQQRVSDGELDQLITDIKTESESANTPWLRVVSVVHNPDEVLLDLGDEDAVEAQPTLSHIDDADKHDELISEQTLDRRADEDEARMASISDSDSPYEPPQPTDIASDMKTADDIRERDERNSQQSNQGDIPYGERHKRTWEQYIERADPDQGSMTHRRLARELDAQAETSVSMDYGDEDIVSQANLQPASRRRIVSYEDD